MSSIFARFWRGPHRRDKGAGLGMAICQEIALPTDGHPASE
jgi:signal transduction histidine kinase